MFTLMLEARTSSAPRRMYGKLSRSTMALGSWLRLVATITSRRTARAAWYSISGSGMAMAKTMGKRAMERIMAWSTTPAVAAPRNTSAPAMPSASVRGPRRAKARW